MDQTLVMVSPVYRVGAKFCRDVCSQMVYKLRRRVHKWFINKEEGFTNGLEIKKKSSQMVKYSN